MPPRHKIFQIKYKMLGKRCKNCNEKVKNNHSFCPSCGTNLNSNSEDYGLLGRNDSQPPFQKSNGLFGNLTDKMMTKMLGSAMKLFEKEFEKNVQEPRIQKNQPRMRLMINGKEINNQEISKIQERTKDNNLKKLPIEFSKEKPSSK